MNRQTVPTLVSDLSLPEVVALVEALTARVEALEEAAAKKPTRRRGSSIENDETLYVITPDAENPWKRGNYAALFDAAKAHGAYTRGQLRTLAERLAEEGTIVTKQSVPGHADGMHQLGTREGWITVAGEGDVATSETDAEQEATGADRLAAFLGEHGAESLSDLTKKVLNSALNDPLPKGVLATTKKPDLVAMVEAELA